MPKDDVQRFMERLTQDEVFRSRVLAAPDVAARLELARAEGYEVDRQQIEDIAARLSDAALHGVVGDYSELCPTRGFSLPQ